MIKPFEEDIVEKPGESASNIHSVAPFEEEVSSDIKINTATSQTTATEMTFKEEIQADSIFQSSINLLSSLSGLLIAFILFTFIAVFAHTIKIIYDVLHTANLSDILYLSGLLILFTALVMNVVSNIKQMKQLKNAKRIQDKFSVQKKEPTEEIITLSHELFIHYDGINHIQQKEPIERIKNKLSNSKNHSEIYNDLDTLLLSPIDKKAKEMIHKASLQIAVSTAVSSVPIIDMLIIIWRSFMLTKEISALYGYRPGGLTSLLLLKQGAVNIVFAGVSELTLELANEITSATVLHKISQAAGQGVANGILLTRLGYGVIDACRPIKLTEKKENSFKSITGSLIESLKVKPVMEKDV